MNQPVEALLVGGIGVGESEDAIGVGNAHGVGAPDRRRRQVGRPFHFKLFVAWRAPLEVKAIIGDLGIDDGNF